jgi:hypothetical protein
MAVTIRVSALRGILVIPVEAGWHAIIVEVVRMFIAIIADAIAIGVVRLVGIIRELID